MIWSLYWSLLMAHCKTAASLLPKYLRYCSLALNQQAHRYICFAGWWQCIRLWYLQCINSGDNKVFHLTIWIISTFVFQAYLITMTSTCVWIVTTWSYFYIVLIFLLQADNNVEYVLEALDVADMQAWLTSIQQWMRPNVQSEPTVPM